MDKEYIKGIIKKIVDGNEEKHLSPSNAPLVSVISAVKEDLVETLRDMCEKREIGCNRTINSASFKLLQRMWEREIEIAAGTPVIYVKDLDVKSKIKESGASLKEKGVEVRNGYFKGGSFSLNADFTVENPEELERFILEATYGKQINAIVEKLNGEWRSKFYKL